MGNIATSAAAAGLVVSALVYRAYRKEIGAARARVASQGKVIETECGPLGHADIGQGPVVLAIHGAGGGFDQGLLIAKANGLTERDYRIVAPSRFGYLQTPLPTRDATPARQADAHACLLDALGIREKVAVIGTSAGALSAMQFAIRYPERTSALVLQGPDSWAPPETRNPRATGIAGSNFILKFVLRTDFIMWAFTKVARGSMFAFMGMPQGLRRRATAEEIANAEALMQTILPVSQRYQGILQDAVNSSSLERYPLEEIQASTLIIDAKDVVTFPGSTYTAEHVPKATLIAYERGSHLLVGHGNEASKAIREFLRQYASDEGKAEAA